MFLPIFVCYCMVASKGHFELSRAYLRLQVERSYMMSTTKLHTLAEVGQSAWLDYIDRELITSGGLTTYVLRGLRGVTSNPDIFHKAISEGNDYDVQIQ